MAAEKFGPADRMNGISYNIWTEFNQMSNTYKPKADLARGAPDYPGPKYVRDAMIDTMLSEDPLMSQYCRGHGHLRLVNVLAKLYSRFIGRQINPLTEVLVTIGACESLYSAVMSHVNPGDEVIIMEPFFTLYNTLVKLAGGVAVYVPLRQSKAAEGQKMSSADWKLDEDELASKFNSKTKAIFINNPHNPIGKVFKRDELQVIADLTKKWDVLVIVDEVYEFCFFDDNEHVRMASLPGMWERTLTVSTAGKSLNATGLKLGWMYGPENLIKNSGMVHQITVYGCPSSLQEAVAVCFELEYQRLGTPECFFEQLRTNLAHKRDKLIACLERVGMAPIVPEGGYFVMADFTEIAGKLDYDDGSSKAKDYKFCLWLVREKKLTAFPPTGLYQTEEHKCQANNYIRMCFVKEDSALDEAERIILELKND